MTTTRPPAPDVPRISFCLTDVTGRVLLARDPERVHYAASTMKLAVLLAASREVALGHLGLDRQIPVGRTFTGSDGAPFALTGDHLDPALPAPGTPMTLAELLDAMIVRSSNEATNLVIELIGLPAVAAAVTASGTQHTRVERLIGDGSALAAGLTNEVTAADLTTLVRVATTGRLPGWTEPLPPALVERHVAALERQTTAPIGAALPKGVRWGSKSGEVDGIRHDVAFVGDPGSDAVRHLAVCTQGLGETSADEAIAALTEALLAG